MLKRLWMSLVAFTSLAVPVTAGEMQAGFRGSRTDDAVVIGGKAGFQIVVFGDKPDTFPAVPVPRGLNLGDGELVADNGRWIYRYELTPVRGGLYRIGPVRVTRGGVAADLGYFRLHAIAPASRKRVVLDQFAVSEKAVVGECVKVRLRLYVSREVDLNPERIKIAKFEVPWLVAVGNADAPALDEFGPLTEEGAALILDVGHRAGFVSIGFRQIHGPSDRYAFEFAYYFYPLGPGRVTLDPATIEFHERRVAPADGTPGTVAITAARSEKLEIPVDPPSSGEFGAVGDFAIFASADTSAITVGETVTLDLRVEGRGAPLLAGPPVFAPPDSFEVLDVVERAARRTGLDALEISRATTFKLRARTPGRHALGPFTYRHYSHVKGPSEAVAKALAVVVSPRAEAVRSDVAKASPVERISSGPPPGVQSPDEGPTVERFSPIAVAGDPITLEQRRIRRRILIAVVALSWGIFLMLWVFERLRTGHGRGADTSGAALTCFRRGLSRANDADAVAVAFDRYVAARLGLGAGRQSAEKIVRALKTAPPDGFSATLGAFFAAIDAARYSRGDYDPDRLFTAAKRLVDEIERRL